MPQKTALIVEDNKDLRRIFSLAFRKDGYAVVTAADGQEALDYLATQDADVIILDVNMPRVSGLDVLRQVRERTDYHHKIIMVTADYRAEQGDIAQMADLFLIKPVSTRDLIVLANRLTENE